MSAITETEIAQSEHKRLMQEIKNIAATIKPEKPTTFIGENASVQMCKRIPEYGVSKILLVTDKGLISLGLHEKVLTQLEAMAFEVVIYDEVQPDPTIAKLTEGIAFAKTANIDGVVAIGGGSSIDTAKIIAAALTNNMTVDEMAGLFKLQVESLPLFAIPTTAGTGSEATMGAIAADPEKGVKFACSDRKFVPKMAALDPLLTLGLPKTITAATGIDTLVHGVEAYLSILAHEDNIEKAKITIQSVFKYLKAAYDDSQNIEAREGMSYAAFMGGLSINSVGTGYIHAFAHNLGSFYHVPHGQANAYTMAPVLNIIKKDVGEQLAVLAVLIGVGKESETTEVLADKFIDACRELCAAVGIPSQCPELLEKDHEVIYENAQEEAMREMGVPSYLSREEGLQILQAIQP